ncbi:MAG: hypothetical protein CALGDGBN_02791 [Pseudomonadales bacterium]|nr:hypothetical protein [Pseudomonadales bacterium]
MRTHTPWRWLLPIALLGALVSSGARAEQYWVDAYLGQRWETSTDACRDGEAEPRVAAKRTEQPSLQWRYANLTVDEWSAGAESRCIFTIEKRATNYAVWAPDQLVVVPNYRYGEPDLCPRGTVDADTGRCLPRMAGRPRVCNGTNPCDDATGNKFEAETDYRGEGFGALEFTRYYNSRLRTAGALGYNWRSNWDRRVAYSGTAARATVFREDGQALIYTLQGSAWVGAGDVRETLTRLLSSGAPAGWELRLTDGGVERYDAFGRLVTVTNPAGQVTTLAYATGGTDNGRLQSVTGPNGLALALVYDANGRIATLTDPNGKTYTYSYDTGASAAQNRLLSVKYPSLKTRYYLYEHATFTRALTGIVDEAGKRYATFGYDAATGAVTLSEHAGGQRHFTLSYPSATQTHIVDAAGHVAVHTYGNPTQGVLPLVARSLLVDGVSDGKTLEQQWDGNNRLLCRKDEENRITLYTYASADDSHVATQTSGLAGSACAPCLANVATCTTDATRTRSFTWLSPHLDLITSVSEPGVWAGGAHVITTAYEDTSHPYLPTRITESGFTPAGAAVSRATTFSYAAAGQLATVDGPRTDVADTLTYSYYTNCAGVTACGRLGQLWKRTDALGRVTTFNTYNANGRLTKFTDPNGLQTTAVYSFRSWLMTLTRTPPGGGASRSTAYTWFDNGLPKTRTWPDGMVQTFGFNDARELLAVTDPLGGKQSYDYDARGNLQDITDHNPDGTPVRTVHRVFDPRNHLQRHELGGPVTGYDVVVDAVGNLRSLEDPNDNPATTHQYDALNRRTVTLDALGGQTTFVYDALDRPIEVTAPNGATTVYGYDDLGNLLSEQSPDRGTTTFTYDNAGNMLTRTDARAVQTQYTYDALNRPTAITYPDAVAENVTYTYDTCPLGLGRLCAVTDAGGSESYAYDAFGNRTGVQRTELGVSYQTDYTYDARDRLASIAHAPDGRLVSYTRDALGRISAVSTTVGGVATTLVSNRQYRGDGLLAAQVFGNGLAETRSHDLRGWALSQAVGAVDARSYGAWDPNGNLLSLQGSAVAATFGYDALDRLSAETRPGTSYGYLYDANGNRTRSTTNATAVEAVYVAQSNRLATLAGAQVTYDAAGNLTLQGAKAFGYNAAGRLATVTDAGVPKATYVHAHTGARSRKVLSGSTLVFARDGAGRLLREHRANGSLVRLYVWADAEPIAQIERALDGSETLAYLHTDRQAMPRLATNAAATVVWRFEARAFGEGGAQTDPDGDGTTLNVRLRYPGQYFDSESGLFDNYFRYYDPATGRYITSDPIGLAGGLNTYTYALNNPLYWIDPLGLDVSCTYSQSAGRLVCHDTNTGQKKVDDSSCYSGSQGGGGKNDPSKQDQRDVGPIPRGGWDIGNHDSSKGPLTIDLIPQPGNDVFNMNRDPNSFRVHGDSSQHPGDASEGCIVCGRSTRSTLVNEGGSITVTP